MRRSVSRFTLVLALSAIVNALGCSDEVAVTLDEVEAVQQQVLNLLEQRVEHTASAAARAETARAEAQIVFDQAPGHFSDGPFAVRDRQMTDADVKKRELTYALRSANEAARRAEATHERAQLQLSIRTTRYSEARAALRRAHEDDTWDAFALARTGNPGASARSIVITYLRELEDERTRLESLAAESQP